MTPQQEMQFVKRFPSNWSLQKHQDRIQTLRDVMIGVVAGLGLIIVGYIALSMINALDNLQATYAAQQLLIQSQTHFNRSRM
jgi:hypothetical protein